MLWHMHSISQLYFPKLFTNILPTLPIDLIGMFVYTAFAFPCQEEKIEPVNMMLIIQTLTRMHAAISGSIVVLNIPGRLANV